MLFADMSLSRASTTHSTTSDDSINSISILSPHNFAVETAAQPDFHIFTSLIWVRRPNPKYDPSHQCQELTKTPTNEGDFNFLVPDDSQPDLGLLRFHLDRLIDTAEALKWRFIPVLERTEYSLSLLRFAILNYLRCLSDVPRNRVEFRKLRIAINKRGLISIDSSVMSCLPTSDCTELSGMFGPKTFNLDINGMAQTASGRTPCQVFVDRRPSQPSLFTTHKTSYREPYNAARTRAGILSSAPTDQEVLLYNKNGEIMEASLCTVYFFKHDAWITPAAICGGNLGVTRQLALKKGLCIQGTIELSEINDGEIIWLSNGARGFFVGQICLHHRNSNHVFESDANP